ncbi:MAG TPA: hypothetical protein VF375_08690 [Candidatus Limnocylindrales bacterium]
MGAGDAEAFRPHVMRSVGRGERSGAHAFQLTYEIVPEAGLLVEMA